MKKEKQRIALAEACGWRFEPRRAIRPDGSVTNDFPIHNQLFHVPDYPNDLNAMHEAEKVLSREDDSPDEDEGSDWEIYVDYLCNKLGSSKPINATAAQRAEAFLRTIGKWEDEP